MAYIQINNDEIHYSIQGHGDPVIMLHGLAAKSQQVQNLMSNFTDIQLITLDFPGHGLSNYPTNLSRVSFDYYTDIVIKLMDSLSIPKAIIGGISMGAGVSINAALRFPKRVKAIIPIRPAWLDLGMPENLQLINDGADYIDKNGGVEAFKEIDSFINLSNNLPKAAQSVLGIFDVNQHEKLHLVLKQMVADVPFEDFHLLGEIKIPVCIIGNENDPLHPFDFAEQIKKAIPQSKLFKVISRYINNGEHKLEVEKIISAFLLTI